MARYRVLYGDLRGGTLVGELPVSSLSFSKVLNGAGELTAEMPLDTSTEPFEFDTEVAGFGNMAFGTGPFGLFELIPVTDRSSNAGLRPETFTPARTAIYVERDGVILWAGILWAYRMNVGANSLEVSAQGLWSYFHRQHITDTLLFSGNDQAEIARGILSWAQSREGGHIRVEMGTETHGVTRQRTYEWFDSKNVAEAIEDLAAVINGFDFYIDSRWSGNRFVNTFRTVYPATGRLTDFVFDGGSNAELVDVAVDASSMVNQAVVIGGADTAELPYAKATQSWMLEAGYPLLQAVESDQDVTELATLTAKAERALLRGKVPIQQVTLALLPHLPPGLGSFLIGDRVRVRGNYGFLDIDGMFRIVEMRVTVDESGLEDISVALANQEVFE